MDNVAVNSCKLDTYLHHEGRSKDALFSTAGPVHVSVTLLSHLAVLLCKCPPSIGFA